MTPPDELPSLFDASRSGRIGRMPSKSSLGAFDDSSTGARKSRMLSKSSLWDANSNGGVHPQRQPGVVGTSLSLPHPPVMGKTRRRPRSPDAVSGGGTEAGGDPGPPHPRQQQRADEAKEAQATAVVADHNILVPPSE